MPLANVAIAAQEEMIVSNKGTATVKAADMNQGLLISVQNLPEFRVKQR